MMAEFQIGGFPVERETLRKLNALLTNPAYLDKSAIDHDLVAADVTAIYEEIAAGANRGGSNSAGSSLNGEQRARRVNELNSQLQGRELSSDQRRGVLAELEQLLSAPMSSDSTAGASGTGGAAGDGGGGGETA